ncbi:4-hydroxythreonine-4-phosphate dehydrogenase 1 [Betaproteobacteria bacterium]|nr:4-hydroxythreonine-4-phosphate dehydrogenase 1 [Betaproteobacteria bacterium]GHU14779.1 4-hydroxythreonine-4-phosphate dehydrogenase 1 [Betaproteobacteria bacterium]
MRLLAVTSGEPAGIGPEICLRLADFAGDAHPVILADRELLAERARLSGLNITLRNYAPGNLRQAGALDVLHLPLAVPSQPGKLDPANSAYVLALLDRALTGCQSGEFAAMVTAPLHKGVINEARLLHCPHFTGHTEYLAEMTHTPGVVMMLAGATPHAHADGNLRVALVTTHLPLKNVAAAITAERLTEILRILHRELQTKYGFASPRILVTGLNPHAGEGGYLGREELEIINPTLKKLRHEGMNLIGALPADTLFTPPILAQGDAVLAMYHDQGLAPLKYATFGHGINITLGLPMIRTSVDHGTALDLAGSGKANFGSLFAAVREAARMATAKEK